MLLALESRISRCPITSYSPTRSNKPGVVLRVLFSCQATETLLEHFLHQAFSAVTYLTLLLLYALLPGLARRFDVQKPRSSFRGRASGRHKSWKDLLETTALSAQHCTAQLSVCCWSNKRMYGPVITVLEVLLPVGRNPMDRWLDGRFFPSSPFPRCDDTLCIRPGR